MKLDELRKMIMESRGEDWHLLTCWGGGGPSYLNSYTIGSGSDGWGITNIESHSNLAIYRSNIDLRLAWGLPASSQDEKLSLPWQDRFTKKTVESQFVDVLWRGALVHRDQYWVVDGGRAYLPDGPSKYEGQGKFGEQSGEWITDEIAPWDYLLIKLVHSFEHSESYDVYFNTAGMTLLQD